MVENNNKNLPLREDFVFQFGAAEDIQLEPYEGISDWLLSGPDIDWMSQLKEAARTNFVQQYYL